jgi:hypothetical protein
MQHPPQRGKVLTGGTPIKVSATGLGGAVYRLHQPRVVNHPRSVQLASSEFLSDNTNNIIALFLAGRLDITAEGVERPEQFAMLMRHRDYHVEGPWRAVATIQANYKRMA